MTDEIDASDELEPAPELGAPGNQEEPEEETNEEDESGEAEEQPEDFYEFEDDDGTKHKIPARLKGHVLRQSDYSRNMNTLKEERSAFEQERESLPKWREAEEAQQRTLGQIAIIDGQLRNFLPGQNGQALAADQIDWQVFHANDPQRAAKEWQRYQMALSQRNALAKQAEEGRQKYETGLKQKTAERLQQTRAYAEKEIPNWSPELDKDIAKLASELGFTEDEILQNISPKFYRMAHLALEGHRSREAIAKRGKAPSQGANVQPLKTVGSNSGGGASTRDPAKMDMDQFAPWLLGKLKKAG